MTLRRLDDGRRRSIRAGRWTQENFQRLWTAGLAATGGDESWLSFLSYPAEPVGSPSPRKGGCREGISASAPGDRAHSQASAGWSPRLTLSRPETVYWNGKLLPSARGEFQSGGRDARFRLTCDEPDAGLLIGGDREDELGKVVRDTLRTEHAGAGRCKVLKRSSLPGEGGGRRIRIISHCGRFLASRQGGTPPLLWVSPLTKMMSVLWATSWSSAILGTFQNGRGPRVPPWLGDGQLATRRRVYLLPRQGPARESQYLMVEPSGARLIAKSFIATSWPSSSSWARLFSARSCTACSVPRLQRAWGQLSQEYSRHAHSAISDHLDFFERWIEPFFSKLSRALREDTTAKLNAVEASWESRYGFQITRFAS